MKTIALRHHALDRAPVADPIAAVRREPIEIAALEYDVASVGATEPSHAEENQAAFYLVHYRLPETH